jgi:hypothetical protein
LFNVLKVIIDKVIDKEKDTIKVRIVKIVEMTLSKILYFAIRK